MPGTSEQPTVDRFVDALRRLERDGEVDALVELYAPDAVVGNVLRMDAFRGPDGAREFWTAYRRQFGEVESSFRTVVADQRAASLEWASEATVDGRAVSYAGVTVLELDGASVARSCAYFDPGALATAALGT